MPTKPDRLRDILLVVQILLIALLLISLTLAAIMEKGDTPVPAVTATATILEALPEDTATPSETSAPPAVEVQATATFTARAASEATATPAREPITRTGVGDSVFYPQKWVGPAVVRISYEGAGPLAVWTQNDNGERQDQLVSSVGPYHGDSLIDLFGSQRILRFEVRTAESWQIDVLPLSVALHLTTPGVIQGAGDDVVVLEGPYSPDLLSVDASGTTGDFSVYAFGSQRDQVVGTTGPYTGTVSIPRDTTVLAVKSSGPWRLEITTR